MDILKFIKDNTYGINQLNIPPEEKVEKLLRRFSAICLDFFVFHSVFQDNQSIFGIITEHSEL